MSKQRSSKTPRLLLCAASAIGLALLAVPVSAEQRDGGRYYQSGDENIEVTAPRYRGPSDLNAPVRNVGLQRDVRFDDLDLRTSHGERVLKNRIRQTARNLCRQLNTMYPVSADDTSTIPGPGEKCYTTAVDDAMQQANAAIEHQRFASND